MKSTAISAKTILDLGAGTGLLTKYIVELFPGASYTLVDLSEKMLKIAKKRFSNSSMIRYEIMDYASSFPQGKYDLVVSGLSLHHLEDKRKQKLYGRIHDSLENGGYLINLDQFNAINAEINDFYTKNWYQYISDGGINDSERNAWLQRRELDKENTISDSVQMMKNAGFKYVECIYQYMKFGVLVAAK